LIDSKYHNLSIKLDRVKENIPYISSLKPKVLVGIIINPTNYNMDIIKAFNIKLVGYSTSLILYILSPQEIIE